MVKKKLQPKQNYTTAKVWGSYTLLGLYIALILFMMFGWIEQPWLYLAFFLYGAPVFALLFFRKTRRFPRSFAYLAVALMFRFSFDIITGNLFGTPTLSSEIISPDYYRLFLLISYTGSAILGIVFYTELLKKIKFATFSPRWMYTLLFIIGIIDSFIMFIFSLGLYAFSG